MRPLDLSLQPISPYNLLTYKNKNKANKQTKKTPVMMEQFNNWKKWHEIGTKDEIWNYECDGGS